MSDLSDTLDSLQNGINGLVDNVKGGTGAPLLTAIGGAVAGAAITGAVIAGIGSTTKTTSSTTRKKRKKISHTKRGWKQDRARRSKQKWEVAYQKRKRKKHSKRKHKRAGKRSRSGIHFTKNGQPYKLLSSGKARFIKRRR